MYRFNLYAIPPFLAGLYLLLLALLIYFKGRRVWMNFVCSLIYYSCAVWLLGYSVLYTLREPQSLFWPKFVYSGVVYIAPTLYHFSVTILDLKNQRRFVYVVYTIATFFLFLLLFTNKFIIGLKPRFWGYHTLVNIPVHIIFLTFFTITYILAVRNLISYYRRKKTQQGWSLELIRIKYIILAYTISVIGALDYLPDWGLDVYPLWGYIFVSIGISFFAYAVVKHRLMDITITITRTGIFVAVYTLVLGLPFILTTFGRLWLIRYLGANWWLGPLLLMVVLATTGPFIYIFFQKRAEAILLREQRRRQDTLKKAASGMTRIRNLNRLLDFVASIISDTLQISYIGIYLIDQTQGRFDLKASISLPKNQPTLIEKDSILIRWLQEKREPIIYEEIKHKCELTSEPMFNGIKDQMEKLKGRVIIPGFLENKILSIFILGDKLSRKIYTTEDLNILSVLSYQASLAFENALLYGNIEEQVRQRTEQLIQTQRQLVQAEKLATVGTLASGVAHEINNPLAAILTNAQMLLMVEEGEDEKESLKLIEEAAKRCRNIIQKLMTYSRKPLGGRQISTVDLEKVLDNVISFLGYQLNQDNIKIQTELKNGPFLIKGCQNELEQVFTNLILNGKDAIKKIKKEGSIIITITRDDSWIYISVKDDGVGISPEHLSKIFDPFFTTKDVGKGTGLGLSICQSIVEAHNGNIDVDSRPGMGATFNIRLPTKISDNGDVALTNTMSESDRKNSP